MITDAAFWRGAAERAMKTFLQAFLAVLGVQAGAVLTAGQAAALPWLTALVTATLAALLSLATSVGNADFTRGAPPKRAADD